MQNNLLYNANDIDYEKQKTTQNFVIVYYFCEICSIINDGSDKMGMADKVVAEKQKKGTMRWRKRC